MARLEVTEKFNTWRHGAGFIEQLSTEYCVQSKYSHQSMSHQNSKYIHVTDIKRGKTGEGKSRLAFILLLIG